MNTYPNESEEKNLPFLCSLYIRAQLNRDNVNTVPATIQIATNHAVDPKSSASANIFSNTSKKIKKTKTIVDKLFIMVKKTEQLIVDIKNQIKRLSLSARLFRIISKPPVF